MYTPIAHRFHRFRTGVKQVKISEDKRSDQSELACAVYLTFLTFFDSQTIFLAQNKRVHSELRLVNSP